MGKWVNQPVVAQRAPMPRPVLAADVGGTHARVALVVGQADPGQPVQVLAEGRYAGAEWPSLGAILHDFLKAQAHMAPLGIERCAIAIAGYVLGDNVANSNLPWPVSLSGLRAATGAEQLDVVNDFEAVAYASQFIDRAQTTALLPGAESAHGPVVIMGPGTGLGSAVLLPGATCAQVLPTEAGQIALAPGDEREMAILRVLARTRPYVSVESIVSGPGLLATYRAVAELEGRDAPLPTPAAVSSAGLAGSDPVACAALDVFCAVLGGFTADLAMLYGATGGVFLAGGILPSLHAFLLTSRFRERFFNKGVMRPFLERVPVHLVEHGQLGVVGAATMHAGARVGTAH
ncbi:MAG: glucokinase [Luteibacter sp.]